MSEMAIFTIGHGTIELNKFLQNLRQNKITLLIDVRSIPYSSYASQFNRETLEKFFRGIDDIRYVFLGDQLGGKPKDPALLTDGLPDYQKMRNAPQLKDALSRIVKYVDDKQGNVVLMCSEEDPERCHRYLLLSECLFEAGHEVCHVRHSGDIVPHSRLRQNKPLEQLRLPLEEGVSQ